MECNIAFVFDSTSTSQSHYLFNPCLHYITWTTSDGAVVEHAPGVWEDVDSVPGDVLPTTVKMALVASLLRALHQKVRPRPVSRSSIIECKM